MYMVSKVCETEVRAGNSTAFTFCAAALGAINEVVASVFLAFQTQAHVFTGCLDQFSFIKVLQDLREMVNVRSGLIDIFTPRSPILSGRFMGDNQRRTL